MAEGSSQDPDPWRIVADLAGEASASRADHAELAARLDSIRARFGETADSTEGLLDEVDRYAVIDPHAPLDSSRPMVPGIKLVVRKANAFIARHLANQITMVAGGLSLAIRQVDQRLRLLERGYDGSDAAALLPDFSGAFEETLRALERPAAATRVVRSWAEASTLPPHDTGLVIVVGLGDVLTLPARVDLLNQLVASLRQGGHVAVVGIRPQAWLETVGPLACDLAPGRPMHPQTWAHLMSERGGAGVAIMEDERAYLVSGRW